MLKIRRRHKKVQHKRCFRSQHRRHQQKYELFKENWPAQTNIELQAMYLPIILKHSGINLNVFI